MRNVLQPFCLVMLCLSIYFISLNIQKHPIRNTFFIIWDATFIFINFKQWLKSSDFIRNMEENNNVIKAWEHIIAQQEKEIDRLRRQGEEWRG